MIGWEGTPTPRVYDPAEDEYDTAEQGWYEDWEGDEG